MFSTTSDRPARPWKRIFLGATLATVVLVWLAIRVLHDWQELGADLRAELHFHPLPLAWAWLLMTAGWLLLVDTWRRILARFGHNAPFAVHLRIHAWTALAHVIPGSIWTPAGRVALYRQRGASALDVGVAVIIEWLLLGVAGLLLYVIAVPFSTARPPGGVWLLIAVAMTSLALLHPRALATAKRWAAPRMADSRSGDGDVFGYAELLAFLGREFVVLAASGLALYSLMVAISPKASVGDAMAAWALTVALANLLAWLPFTSLVKDGGMVMLLGSFYGSTVVALGVVIAWRIWMAVVELSWVLLATAAEARGRLLSNANDLTRT